MTLLEEIEILIRERRTATARGSIRRYLQQENYSLSSRLEAAQFLRRLSDFNGALLLLNSTAGEADFPHATAELRSRYNLQLARLLNSLGASAYGLSVLSRVPEDERRKNIDVTLEIYNSNYRYQEALPFALQSYERLQNTSPYSIRLRAVTIADTFYGAGQVHEAILLVEEVIAHSKEPLLLGIAHQARAAYLILSNQIKTAEKSLKLSDEYFPSTDQTFDRAFLDKWIGAERALKGESSQAVKFLNRAFKVLYRPGFKPEAWLEILYWKGLLKTNKRKSMPTEWAQLLAYPAATEHRLVKLIREKCTVENHLVFGKSDQRGMSIDLASQVYETKGKANWGLPLPVQAAGILAIAGEFGMPLFRLCDSLWAEELTTVQANIRRVEQILLRIRSELKLSLRWEAHHAWLESGTNVSSGWSQVPLPRGWGFLSTHSQFIRSDLEQYFDISPRLAQQICKEWLTSRIIVKNTSLGPSTSYRVSF